ncbi:unnamed protein product (macronuclear) [Paramecium tetraurelia]|uniref:Dynein light chain n=1 Tax=Paramecium tetraurelia TaxID=5888 RepID=A0DG69_PARTE|nr:uncharacterized protein GSPATT00002164001 [Paramecium tetraurelia]CAK82036.1 unnamed protein product [Paramecium tetraurelia]|eukprot:XP_001449433.1 hypothetical protein (macronuclear) [Paramecium tetraurelia strain d4-2]
MDSDDEKQVALPPIRIRSSEMKQSLMKDILLSKTNIYRKLLELDELFKKQTLDKDVCVELVKHLRSKPEYKIMGEGEWQCIIGSNFGCSLSYDLELLTFFDFLSNGKSVLLFKSG